MLSLPQTPERGEVLLLTDELASPADFVLHANLAAHLKDSARNARCIVVAISESVTRWTTIASKSNLNVPHLITKGHLQFMDVGSKWTQNETHVSALREIFDEIRLLLEHAKQQNAHVLLILDDISALEWIGFNLADVALFARALCALSRRNDASLIIRHHIVTPEHPDELWRLLLQLCTFRIEVFPLSTGRSGSVSGQVAMYPGPGHVEAGRKAIPRSGATLYRLTDSGCTLFDRGTGATVL